MLIHYVDDDPIDIQIMERLASRSPGVDLAVSSHIEGLFDQLRVQAIDMVILDLHRPEAVSPSIDIERIRKISTAPILILTGSPTDEIRQDIIDAGAAELVAKHDLSAALLRSLAARFSSEYEAKVGLFQDEEAAAADVEGDAAETLRRNGLGDRITVPLQYVEAGLEILRGSLKATSIEPTVGFVNHLIETVRAIERFNTSDLAKATRTPLHDVLRRSHQHLDDLARLKGVSFSMGDTSGWYYQMGPEPLARLGLQHLVEGVVRACGPSDSVNVEIGDEDGSSFVELQVSRAILSDLDSFFGEDAATEIDLGARSSLHLSVLLLGLREQQVELVAEPPGQRIRVHL